MSSTVRGVHAHVGMVTRDLDAAMASVGGMLGLTWEESAHKRVKAVIMYLGEQD